MLAVYHRKKLNEDWALVGTFETKEYAEREAKKVIGSDKDAQALVKLLASDKAPKTLEGTVATSGWILDHATPLSNPSVEDAFADPATRDAAKAKAGMTRVNALDTEEHADCKKAIASLPSDLQEMAKEAHAKYHDDHRIVVGKMPIKKEWVPLLSKWRRAKAALDLANEQEDFVIQEFWAKVEEDSGEVRNMRLNKEKAEILILENEEGK